MLQKATKQRTTSSTDVLRNARLWKIDVKPVGQVLKWLASQENRLSRDQEKSQGKVRALKGAFIKVEDRSRWDATGAVLVLFKSTCIVARILHAGLELVWFWFWLVPSGFNTRTPRHMLVYGIPVRMSCGRRFHVARLSCGCALYCGNENPFWWQHCCTTRKQNPATCQHLSKAFW